MAKVLVVDDQPHVRKALELLFALRDIDVRTASAPEEALAIVRAEGFGRDGIGVVVQDMNFSVATTTGEEGASLFRDLRALAPGLPVVLMTAWGSLEMAVALVKEGAADYLQKPWDDAALLRKVQQLLRAVEAIGNDHGGAFETAGLVFESAEMAALVGLAARVAPSDASILITGPNGAGKEMIAQIVQRNSRRRAEPFIQLNVGALPDELFEAELFGAEAGAFTGATKRRIGRFEAADGGTLFLDELGTLSGAAQAKLLRVLQTGELQRLGANETRQVDVRVIAATNADLRREVEEGRFREDLYYRLAVIELHVPPLVERLDDVMPLALAFLARYAGDAGREAPALGDDAVEALLRHDWPGNVRELQNAIRRAVLVASGPEIRSDDLGLEAAPSSSAESAVRAATSRAPSAAESLEDRTERARIEQALERHDFVVAQAAASLGMSRQALYRRMRRFSIHVQRRRV